MVACAMRCSLNNPVSRTNSLWFISWSVLLACLSLTLFGECQTRQFRIAEHIGCANLMEDNGTFPRRLQRLLHRGLCWFANQDLPILTQYACVTGICKSNKLNPPTDHKFSLVYNQVRATWYCQGTATRSGPYRTLRSLSLLWINFNELSWIHKRPMIHLSMVIYFPLLH